MKYAGFFKTLYTDLNTKYLVFKLKLMYAVKLLHFQNIQNTQGLVCGLDMT